MPLFVSVQCSECPCLCLDLNLWPYSEDFLFVCNIRTMLCSWKHWGDSAVQHWETGGLWI